MTSRMIISLFPGLDRMGRQLPRFASLDDERPSKRPESDLRDQRNHDGDERKERGEYVDRLRYARLDHRIDLDRHRMGPRDAQNRPRRKCVEPPPTLQ